MDDRVIHSSRLSKEQKTGFVLLFLFGVLAIALGVLQLRQTIFSPFIVQVSREEADTKRFFTDQTTRLQQIDTDQDGLNDYEELTFYQTSPYLPDTDSDGLRDKDEINQGSDPVCPAGEVCKDTAGGEGQKTSPEFSPVSTNTFAIVDTIGQSFQDAGGIASGGVSAADLQRITADPKALRDLLRQHGGIPEEQLRAIDDQTLLNLAAQILPSLGVNSLLQSAPTSTVTATSS